MAIFTNVPDQGATKKIVPSVHVAKFGDGYEQRTPHGLVNLLESWDLSFTSRSEAEILAIDAFLRTNKGGSFSWRTPEGTYRWFRCKKWRRNVEYVFSAELFATFEEKMESSAPETPLGTGFIFAALSSSASFVASSLTTTKQLAAAMSGSPTLTASLTTGKAISAALSASSTLTAGLLGLKSIVQTNPAIAMTATMTISGNLQFTADALEIEPRLDIKTMTATMTIAGDLQMTVTPRGLRSILPIFGIGS